MYRSHAQQDKQIVRIIGRPSEDDLEAVLNEGALQFHRQHLDFAHEHMAQFVGYTNLGVTAGYMHVFGDDGDIDQNGTPTNENASRGNLSGTYEVEADVFALSMDYRF